MDSSAADSSVQRIEIDLLMRLAEPFKSILDATETDAYTIHQKNDAWTEISKQYNLDRRFKKKTCRELRKTYQRMVIKNRSRSLEMHLDEDKKPKLKKFKFSDNEEISGSNNGDVLKRDAASVPPPDEKPIENLLQKSVTSDKKNKKENIALSKNCMVIMRPITKAQLKAISNSQSKVPSSVSSKSPPKIQESSIPSSSSSSSFIKLSPQQGTPVSSAGQNVGVVFTIGSRNIVKSSPTHPSLSNMVSLGQRGLGGASSPRQASSPTHPNAISPSRERHTSSVAFAGSNFSSTPGSATLTTMTAQTGSGSASDISVASSTLQPQSTDEVCKKTVINTYSKIHPQVVRQAESTSPQRTHIVKQLVWPTTMQPTSLVSASPKVSSCQSTDFISAAKGASCKPADEVVAKGARSKHADEPPISTTPKVAGSKPGAVVSTLMTTKVPSSKTTNVHPSSTSQKDAISSVAATTASSPTIVSSKPAAAVSPAVPLKVVSCMSTSVFPTTTSPRFAKGKFSKVCLASATHKLKTASSVPDSEKMIPAKLPSSQLTNVTVSSTSTTMCQTARDVDTSSVNYARCQLVPTSQAYAFLSRSTSRFHLKDSVTTSPKSSPITASAESEPIVLTTSVTTPASTSAASSVEFTSPTLSTVQALEEGQNEGINMALAEPEILNIRVLEANLDVRAAQARVEAEEALREEALAKLAMTRAEMDHQALRHKIELRHMRRLNSLALKHAKELHVAALSLRRKE